MENHTHAPVIQWSDAVNQLQKEVVSVYIKNNTVPNVLCFSGPDVTSMLLAARDVIRRKYCIGAGAPCNGCDDCRKINREMHSDVRFFDAAVVSAYSVDNIRSMTNFFHLSAISSRSKSILIAHPELMNDHATNALLKLLEEPPPKALFILVSLNADRLAPTIRSRCCIIDFPPESGFTQVAVEEQIQNVAMLLSAPLATRLLFVSTQIELGYAATKTDKNISYKILGDSFIDMCEVIIRDSLAFKVTGGSKHAVASKLPDVSIKAIAVKNSFQQLIMFLRLINNLRSTTPLNVSIRLALERCMTVLS